MGEQLRDVGFVGLGQMGTPMSAHLLGAGFAVTGHDLDRERAAALAAAGGAPAASPREVATGADVVVTSLPSAAALRHVLTGPDGLLAADDPARLVIVETSTLALDDKEEARRAAEHAGATVLDCPLSGTARQARDKDLVVFASGDAAAVARCAPVFAGFARAHHHLGPFGAGTRMKLVANLLVAVHNVAAAEAFVLARKAGIDPQVLYEVISGGAGSSRMFEVRGPMMAARRYDGAGITGQLFQKDLRLIADFARSLDCPTPLFSAADQAYVAARARGLGDQEVAAVQEVLAHLAGLDTIDPI
jgi:putative dehydrogenase